MTPKERDELIKSKVAAGLTRDQAEMVVDHQEATDKRIAEEVEAKAKKAEAKAAKGKGKGADEGDKK